jgi:protein gp37
VALWNDLFHEQVSQEFQLKVLDHVLGMKRHTFIILTKRALRMSTCVNVWMKMRELQKVPGHMWLGVSVSINALKWRIEILQKIAAERRIVSCEPMIERVDLTDRLSDGQGRIHWVIVGCETGAGRQRPEIDWLETLMQQCKDAKVRLFLKQWDFGEGIEKVPEFNGRQWIDFPE